MFKANAWITLEVVMNKDILNEAQIKEFNEMNILEIKILNKLGISNPYIKS